MLSFPYFVDEYDTDFPAKKLGKGLTEYVLRTGQPALVTPEVHAELERRGGGGVIGGASLDWLGGAPPGGARPLRGRAGPAYTPRRRPRRAAQRDPPFWVSPGGTR